MHEVVHEVKHILHIILKKTERDIEYIRSTIGVIHERTLLGSFDWNFFIVPQFAIFIETSY